MANDVLLKSGLYFDELNKIRVLEPEVAKQTTELKDECGNYVEKIDFFLKLIDEFKAIMDDLQKKVENEKMKAIGSRNLLKSVSKQRLSLEQQLQAMTTQKRIQLERLNIQYEALKKEDNEQTEYIEQLMLQK